MSGAYRFRPPPPKGSTLALDAKGVDRLNKAFSGRGSPELRDFISRKFSAQDQVQLFQLAQDAAKAARKQAADVRPSIGVNALPRRPADLATWIRRDYPPEKIIELVKALASPAEEPEPKTDEGSNGERLGGKNPQAPPALDSSGHPMFAAGNARILAGMSPVARPIAERVGVDNFGAQPRRKTAVLSSAALKAFDARFPGVSKIGHR